MNNLTCNFDVLNEHGEKIGEKIVKPVEKGQYLNDWFERPKGTVPAVPLSSAITVKSVKSGCETLSEKAFGYSCLNSNDPLNNNFVTFVSSAFSKGHGTSITPDLFEKAMTVVAVRKAIKPTWLNDRDQFQIPKEEPSREFVVACVVWNLFSGHNQTSEFTADYKDKKWKIQNEFYPLDNKLAKSNGPQTMAFQRSIPTEETWVWQWLCDNLDEMNGTTAFAFQMACDYYQLFWQNYNNVNRTKWKIEGPRPGFYQIRNAMKEANIGDEEYEELRAAVKTLQDWIVPRVYSYGFLEPEKTL